MGAASAARTGSKYVAGSLGNWGVLPSSVSPTAEIVTLGIVVVVGATLVVATLVVALTERAGLE